MRDYYRSFLDEIKDAYRFVSQEEALSKACSNLAVFADPYSQDYERLIAINDSGRYVGALNSEDLRNTLISLYYRCSQLSSGQRIYFSPEEKQFIKAGIEGSFFKTFYE